MANYFETVCQYEQIQETGKAKKVSENLLFEAESFADAEFKLIEHMSEFDNEEYFIKDIRRKKIDDVYDKDNAEKWYDVKVVFSSVDERGNEKKTTGDYFVHANSSEDASSEVHDNLKDCLQDWEIHTIRESTISEMFMVN